MEGSAHAERLRLDLALHFPWRDESEVWTINCVEPRRWLLKSDDSDPVALASEHALLWEHTEDHCELYFQGRSGDDPGLLGGLYQRHRQEVEDWVPFPRFLNRGMALSELLTAGHGLLGSGPTPLMEAYAAVLIDHGMRATMLGPQPPRRLRVDGDIHSWMEEDRDLVVLTLGGSFVVAEAFVASLK